MVHMKIITKSSDVESPESQLIKLERSQASKVPFPPGCPVLVLDKSQQKTSVLYSGEVFAVYVSFDHNSGSCRNCYKILSKGSSEKSEIVSGDRIRYAINCPIKISSKTDKVNDDEAVEGTIKGFEIMGENEENDGPLSSFLYTVDVTAIGTHNEERTFRQRGISPEHIRFRDTTTMTSLHQTDFDRTSVVSLDDSKLQSVSSSSHKTDRTPKAHYTNTGTFSIPSKSPTTPTASLTTPKSPLHTGTSSDTSSPNLVLEGENKEKAFSKCYPLPQPHPAHFQGKLDPDVRIPDFSFLTNFSLVRSSSMDLNLKRCVMCGETRSCSVGKSNKTKSMKSSAKYSQDAIVIPNQNKGLCTLCDVNVWVIRETGLQIKWCKGCKNFKAWATFGEKGSATKCLGCRDRQREKYAASKRGKRKIDTSEPAQSPKRSSLA